MNKSNIRVREPQTRTLTKTVLFRLISIITVYLISISFGFSIQMATTIVSASIVVGTITYYLHDRAWNLINWNRNENFKETKLRSVVKTIVYRIIIFIVVAVSIRLIATDSNAIAASFATANLVVNMVLYFVTERVASYIGRRQSHV